jgi:hypothetical protein
MVNIFKRLGRSLGGATRWVGRQIKHAGQLQNKFLDTVNNGAKGLGRQVSKLPGGSSIVSGVKKVISDVKVPIINKSIGDLYNTGREVSKNVENMGRSVNNLGMSVQTSDRAKQLAAMRAVRQQAMNTGNSARGAFDGMKR